MIVILAKNYVKNNEVDKFIEYAEKLVEESRKEKGCISYDLCQDLQEKNVFMFVEKYENEEAIDIHNKSNHFTTIVPKLKELRQRESEVSKYETMY